MLPRIFQPFASTDAPLTTPSTARSVMRILHSLSSSTCAFSGTGGARASQQISSWRSCSQVSTWHAANCHTRLMWLKVVLRSRAARIKHQFSNSERERAASAYPSGCAVGLQHFISFLFADQIEIAAKPLIVVAPHLYLHLHLSPPARPSLHSLSLAVSWLNITSLHSTSVCLPHFRTNLCRFEVPG